METLRPGLHWCGIGDAQLVAHVKSDRDQEHQPDRCRRNWSEQDHGHRRQSGDDTHSGQIRGLIGAGFDQAVPAGMQRAREQHQYDGEKVHGGVGCRSIRYSDLPARDQL